MERSEVRGAMHQVADLVTVGPGLAVGVARVQDRRVVAALGCSQVPVVGPYLCSHGSGTLGRDSAPSRFGQPVEPEDDESGAESNDQRWSVRQPEKRLELLRQTTGLGRVRCPCGRDDEHSGDGEHRTTSDRPDLAESHYCATELSRRDPK